jgi:hypothetical protein
MGMDAVILRARMLIQSGDGCQSRVTTLVRSRIPLTIIFKSAEAPSGSWL